jgi:hypothetical protein
MSLMSLGISMNVLKKGIKDGALATKEQVKEAAMKMNVSVSAGYENLTAEEKELWYDQLATNVFVHQKNWIPCFMDIGFNYAEPTPKTEHKVPWVEIDAKKSGTYREWKLNGTK